MKRRHFLKAGLSISTAALFNKIPVRVNSATQHNDSSHSKYAPGNQICEDAFVVDKELKSHTIVEICHKMPDGAVNVLYIYGGGAYKHANRLGGIWCPDSFEDLHIVRFIHKKYKTSQVQIIPVACPPVYSSQNYGFTRRVFLDEPEESTKYVESVAAFIESTNKIVQNKYLPVTTYFDLRYRLLFNRKEALKPGEGYGTIYEWQGKFRGSSETQKYGTPTIWLLNSKGMVLKKPFWGNLYHSTPYEIRYTIVDVDKAIQQNLSF